MTSGPGPVPITNAPRGTWELLGDPKFGTLFWGKMGSLIATWAFTVVIVTAAYDLTESPTWVGLVGAAQMAPQLVLALASGRLSDLRGERTPIVVGCLLQGFACLGLATWWSLVGNGSTVRLYALVVCALLSGCGLALSTPAMHSIVRWIVTPAEMSTAVALNTFPMAVSRTAGPAIGAALFVAAGAKGSIVAIGLVFLVATAALMRLPSQPSGDADGRGDPRIRGALRYVVRDRVLLAYLGAVALIGAGAEPVITLAPALGASLGDAGSAGWIMASFGAGGMLGVFVHRFAQRLLSPSLEGFIALTVLSLTLIVSTLVPGLAELVAVMMVAGCSMVLASTAFSVAVQERCDPEFNGRVMALWVLAFAGVRPVAAVVVGAAADQWTVQAAFVGTAVTVLVAMPVLCSLVAPRKRVRGPAPTNAPIDVRPLI